MSRKNKAGFNSPFHDLKIADKPKPALQKPAPKARHDQPATDEELFLRAVGEARPVSKKRPARIEPEKTLEKKGPSDDDLALAEFMSFASGEGEFALTDSDEFQSGAAPGVSNELLHTLRDGGFAFRRHIDLHGLSRDDAHIAVKDFVQGARKDGERCVLVITGRGKSSPTGVSVLKETLPRWLSRAPLSSHVLAFCTAQAVHGGPGAFYVLLRRTGVRPFGA